MPVTSVTQGQELSRRNRDRWRGPAVSSPNVPAQSSPGSGPLGQDGAADPRQNGLGRELRGFAGRYPLPRGTPDANLPVGSAANPAGAAGSEGPHEINVNRREQAPFAPRRNPSALGAIGVPPPAVAPSTDSVHGAQSAGFPAVIPHAGPLPGALPSTMAPGGVLGRAGSRGLGEPQIARPKHRQCRRGCYGATRSRASTIAWAAAGSDCAAGRDCAASGTCAAARRSRSAIRGAAAVPKKPNRAVSTARSGALIGFLGNNTCL